MIQVDSYTGGQDTGASDLEDQVHLNLYQYLNMWLCSTTLLYL